MHTHGHTHGRTLAIHTRPYKGKTVTRPYRKNASTAVPGKSWHGRVHKKNADTAVTQLYSNKYLISYISCTFKRPVMFNRMNVKNGSKDLKRYPQISRRVTSRDTLARLFTSGGCALDRVVLSSTAVHTLCTLVEFCTAAHSGMYTDLRLTYVP